MFLSHWFELGGIDQIMAPIDPDNAPPPSHQDDGNGDGADFWEIVAPRAPPSNKKDASASMGSHSQRGQGQQQRGGSSANYNDGRPTAQAASSLSGSSRLVKCQHCHKMTPVDGPSTSSSPTTPSANDLHPKTPHSSTPYQNDHPDNHFNNTDHQQQQTTMFETSAILTEQSFLQAQVLEAAQQTALTSSGPTFLWENKHKLFGLCCAPPKAAKKNKKGDNASNSNVSTTTGTGGGTTDGTNGGEGDKPPISMSKSIKKIHKLLSSKPDLVKARSANMSTLGLPDGYTILHAACHAGNGEVVEYLLQYHVFFFDDNEGGGNGSNERVEGGTDTSSSNADNRPKKLDLNERDMQGRTALHIAADRGHIEVIHILKGAYEKLNERMEKLLLDEDDSSSEGSDAENESTQVETGGVGAGVDKVVDESLTEEMAKLSTSNEPTQPKPSSAISSTATPTTKTKLSPKRSSTHKTPKSSQQQQRRRRTKNSPMRTPRTPMSRSPMNCPMPPHSRSPKPPSRSPMRSSPMRSPTFAGPSAPIDLSGRTPLGYAATSPVPKAKKHRSELEKVLYQPGDRSIVGHGGCAERTPPKARCGPQQQRVVGSRGPFMSPNGKVVVNNGGSSGGSNSSYLSPTPQKTGRLFSTPGSVASSKFATPFQSPPTIQEEEEPELVLECTKDENALKMRQLQWGASEMNGWRIEMEDKILVKYELYGRGEIAPPRPSSLGDAATSSSVISMGLFGVFDGHGDGGYASDYIATNLWPKLQSQPEWGEAYYGCDSNYKPLASALTNACYELDDDLRRDVSKPRDGGTTAVMALVSNGFVFVANVGDSRCILVKKTSKKERSSAESETDSTTPSLTEVIPMSEDHKPDLPEERSRIESAGLSVQTDHVPPDENDPNGEFTTVHRVKKSSSELLGVSRAFGDYDYKSNADLSHSRQAVVCTPEIVVRERMDEEDMYLVLACDGVWDVMTNEEVGEFVARRVVERLGRNGSGSDGQDEEGDAFDSDDDDDTIVKGEVLARVGDDLLAHCLEKGSRDNMSVLIVAFPASGLMLSDGASSNAAAVTKAKTEQVATEDGNAVRALAYE